MGIWSDLQTDLLRLIARRLTVAVDRVRFSAVCRNWLQVATSEPKYLPCPPPWLMLAENSGTTVRRFAGLTTGDAADDRIFELDIPEWQGTRCVGSTGLWVVTLDVKGDIHLLNPFTRQKPPIDLHFEDYYDEHGHEYERSDLEQLYDEFMQKVVISASPDAAAVSEFMFAAIYSGTFTFSRGDLHSWTIIDRLEEYFIDVTLYNGKFYGVNDSGVVYEFDLVSHEKQMRMTVISKTLYHNCCHFVRYLVECSGMFLQVIRTIQNSSEPDHKTVGFNIFKLDLNTKRWTKLNDLGRHSLFVGVNTTVAVLASELLNLEPNCIYFTNGSDIISNNYEKDGNMGVFSLADGTIKPHYRGVSLSLCSPPTWIVPTSLYR